MSELNPYAKFLDGRPLEAILSATSHEIANKLQMIGPDKSIEQPSPGKWSPAEIVCHLADCEIAFAFRLRQTLAEDHHILQPFDQDKWATPYKGIAAKDALAAFTSLRSWNLKLIAKALPVSASKPVTHPERGTMTFQNIVETMAGHDLNHIAQLSRIAKPA
ncbi:DinB family protein [Telmatobacter sp. DSM 110680]|uniref:DinB family protein n=1 Tax=Telmatobacter sp. DSM 110680 TaxID=3036704 RepID=A0AAU7DPY9_9BACT